MSRTDASDAAQPRLPNDQPSAYEPEEDEAAFVAPTDRRRMWAPWRMRYVSEKDRTGCVFCRHAQGDDDREALVLYRDDLVYVVMNLFPYASGHVMIVPVEHTDTLEQLNDDTLVALQRMLPPVLRALRRALRCDGFNVGYNIGTAAGAGIAAHLHEHVVPRWVGDANFMPVLSGTQVLPEMLPATYGKLRAELEREIQERPLADEQLAVILLDPAARTVAVTQESQGQLRLPTTTPEADRPVWQAAAAVARGVLDDAIFLGWAGKSHAGIPFDRAALAMVGRAKSSHEWPAPAIRDELRFVDWTTARAELGEADRGVFEAAVGLF